MLIKISGTMLASALLLNVAAFSWAAEENQPPSKAETMGEMEKKPAMGR